MPKIDIHFPTKSFVRYADIKYKGKEYDRGDEFLQQVIDEDGDPIDGVVSAEQLAQLEKISDYTANIVVTINEDGTLSASLGT